MTGDLDSRAQGGMHSESDITLKSLIAAITEPTALIRLDGEVISANESFRSLVCPSSDDLKGESVYDLSKGGMVRKEHVQVVAQQREPCSFQIEQQENIYIVRYYPVMGMQGEIASILMVFVDMTRRRLLEKSLRHSQERFKVLFENAPDAIYLADLQGHFLDGNRAAEELIGYNKEELLGKSFLNLSLLSFDQIPRVALLVSRNVLGFPTGPDIFMLNRKNGTTIPVEIMTHPIKVGGSSVILGIARDITKRKSAEEALARRNYLFQSLARAINMLITVRDFREAMFQALKIIGEATGVDRVYVYEHYQDAPDTAPLLSQRFIWTRHSSSLRINNPHLQKVAFEGSLRWHGELSEGRSIYGLARNFPSGEKAFLERQHIVSILAVPVILQGKYWGFIGFDECHKEKIWDDVEMSMLSAASSSIGEAIVRKTAEEALAISEAQYRTVVENVNDIIISYDVKGIVCYVSQSATGLGYSPDEVIGRSILDFVHPDDRIRTCRAAEDTIATGQPHPLSLRLISADGQIRYFEESGNAIRDKAGKVIQVVGILHDITERRKNEEELARYREYLEKMIDERTADLEGANRKLRNEVSERMRAMEALEKSQAELQKAKNYAERCNNARGEFLASTSHEVRTPLSTIIGLCEMILNRNNSDEINDFTRLIMSESEVLLDLTSELLDLAKIDLGKVSFEVIPFDLKDLLENLRTGMNIRTSQKGLSLSFHIDDRVPSVVKGDPTRLRQILWNLLGNAIKFTCSGSVDLHVSVKDDGEDRIHLLFEVIDTGIGIPEDRMKEIFKCLMPVASGDGRGYEGTVLGTAIARELVEIMDGTIGVTSEAGKGSTFWFVIPFRKGTEELLPPRESDDGSDSVEAGCGEHGGGRILLAEDYGPNRDIVLSHLSSAGYIVDYVENGRDAVSMAEKSRFDLILMDIMMPEMDGYEATRAIRACQSPNASIPILGLTANAYQKDIEKCIFSGMNGVITKPIRKKNFLEYIDRWITAGRDRERNSILFLNAPVCTYSTKQEALPLDYARALQEFNLQDDILDELVRSFLDACRIQIPLMDEALEKGDTETIRQEAHRIKGGAGNLAADPLAAAAEILERHAKAGDLQEVRGALAAVLKEYKNLDSFFSTIKPQCTGT